MKCFPSYYCFNKNHCNGSSRSSTCHTKNFREKCHYVLTWQYTISMFLCSTYNPSRILQCTQEGFNKSYLSNLLDWDHSAIYYCYECTNNGYYVFDEENVTAVELWRHKVSTNQSTIIDVVKVTNQQSKAVPK